MKKIRSMEHLAEVENCKGNNKGIKWKLQLGQQIYGAIKQTLFYTAFIWIILFLT